MFLKSPADVAALAHGHVAAQEQRRDQALAHLLASGRSSWWIELPEHDGALGVADQDDAAALVVLAQVGLPGGEPRPRRRSAARREGLRLPLRIAAERDLPVHRREDAAVQAVAGRLVERDRALLRVDREIRVRGLVVADGGIDVEAVELPLPVRLDGLGADDLAGRRHQGRVEAGLARVVRDSRLAEPDRGVLHLLRVLLGGEGGGRQQQPSASTSPITSPNLRKPWLPSCIVRKPIPI